MRGARRVPSESEAHRAGTLAEGVAENGVRHTPVGAWELHLPVAGAWSLPPLYNLQQIEHYTWVFDPNLFGTGSAKLGSMHDDCCYG